MYHLLPNQRAAIGTIVEIQKVTIHMSGSALVAGKKYPHSLLHNNERHKASGELAITSCGNSNRQTAELFQTECGVLLFHVQLVGKYLQIPHAGLQVGIASPVDHYIFLVHLRQK